MSRPLVTVVIPFYNCPYIDQAVRSALEQSYSPIEIIVVDDGSTQFADRLDPYRPYIHYLGKANGGTATALNHGIRFAAGEYVAWLSSDDLFYQDKINNQVLFMQQHNAYISHSNFNYIDAYSNITHFSVAPLSVLQNKVDFYRCFLNANPVNGCTVMFRKEIFNHIGLFDENLPYTHDFDLWNRVIQSGFEFPFLNEALVGYRWHSGMGTLRHQQAINEEYARSQARWNSPLLQRISQL